MPPRLESWKPDFAAVTSYTPTGSARNKYVPSDSVIPVRDTLVSVFFAVIVAEGTPAPDASVIVPLIRAVTCACADAVHPSIGTSATSSHALEFLASLQLSSLDREVSTHFADPKHARIIACPL